MNNKGLSIYNLNVACSCACKYCLLRSCKKTIGIDYKKGKEIAVSFDKWRKTKSLNDFELSYTIGYCADYEQLYDNILLNKKFHFPGWSFLQINGIRIKNDSELDKYFRRINEAGITNIDTTFYGLSDFHDGFASRKGDFEYLLKIIEYANEYNINVQPSIPIFEENKKQIGELIDLLYKHLENKKLTMFLPDYRGYGIRLEDVRLNKSSYEKLPDDIKGIINISRYKSEKEWLEENKWSKLPNRKLNLSLTPDTIKTINKMPCDEVIKYLIDIDEKYYSTVPEICDLAKIYGNKENEKLYRERDLRWKWQKQYINDNKINIQDITDESINGSLRY
jgi:hypothetical protein